MSAPKVGYNLNYAVAYAYDNNSNMYECIKYIRKNYPYFVNYEDEEIEQIWDAIDAYADILPMYREEIILRDAIDLLKGIDEKECSKKAWDAIQNVLGDFGKAK
jgi:hypothetical protein